MASGAQLSLVLVAKSNMAPPERRPVGAAISETRAGSTGVRLALGFPIQIGLGLLGFPRFSRFLRSFLMRFWGPRGSWEVLRFHIISKDFARRDFMGFP